MLWRERDFVDLSKERGCGRQVVRFVKGKGLRGAVVEICESKGVGEGEFKVESLELRAKLEACALELAEICELKGVRGRGGVEEACGEEKRRWRGSITSHGSMVVIKLQ